MKLITCLAVVLLIQLAHGFSLERKAESCKALNCTLDNECVCSKKKSPIAVADTPQFVLLTFEEAVQKQSYNELYSTLLFDRSNPDGSPVSATFFVPHEYTDYTLVNDLYNRGFEIGVHSITNNVLSSYWQEASVEVLKAEFQGQRQIVSKFANIPIEDVVGARVPNLVLAGDKLFQAYQQAGIKFDNTWNSFNNQKYFPYTLDYASSQDCFSVCPIESYPKFWIMPIIDLVGNNSVQCTSLTGCQISGSEEILEDWLIDQFNSTYKSRAPITLMLNSAWLRSDNALEAFGKFLDHLAGLEDVFVVSESQVIDWMKNPTAVKDYKVVVSDRSASCEVQHCKLEKPEEGLRYMESCSPCPQQFPWLNNPDGNATD